MDCSSGEGEYAGFTMDDFGWDGDPVEEQDERDE